MQPAHDVVIIGAGPAGLAAALQFMRYGVDVVLVERSNVGGLLNNANLVENYPGFPAGIPGEALVSLFHKQITDLGVKVTNDDIKSIEYEDSIFIIGGKTDDYRARIAVIATGTKGGIPPGLHIPTEIRGKIVTEILRIKSVENKKIVIIGAGDLAFDYALSLAGRNTVTILNRSSELTCLSLLWDRARKCSSVKYQERTRVEEAFPGPNGDVLLKVKSPEGNLLLSCDYVISAIGRQPNLDFYSESFKKKAIELEKKEILHLIGDVKNGIYRQAAIAVGDGIRCAMKVYALLKEKH
jgi:thioredoxin reductase